MQPSNIIKQREAECRDGISLRPVPRCLLTTEECSHLIASLHSSSPIHVAADKTQPPPHTTFPHNLSTQPSRQTTRMRPAHRAPRRAHAPRHGTPGSLVSLQHSRLPRRAAAHAQWPPVFLPFPRSFVKLPEGCGRLLPPRRPPNTPRLPVAASRFAALPLLFSAPRNAAMSLLCYNRGCGQRFDPETNTEGEDGAGGPSRRGDLREPGCRAVRGRGRRLTG